MNKFRVLLNTFTLLLILTSMFPGNIFYVEGSSSGSFIYHYTVFQSSSGGEVYPGSSGAELRIGVQYNGTVNASTVYGCITLPSDLTPRTGCSPAYSLTGNPVEAVEPGDIVEFHYTIDASRNATPGTYSGLLNITYTLQGNSSIHSQIIAFNVSITGYPEPSIRVVKNYWSPAGYPGSNGVSLVLILENDGESTLVNGALELHLPQGFEPGIVHGSINSLALDARSTIVFNGISIYPDTRPGNYTGSLVINALYSTSDGVRYNKTIMIEFNFTVDEPPPVNIEVVDHGLTTNNPFIGTMYTRIYTVFQSLDNALIEAGLAIVELENTYYVNGSSKALISINTPIRYGDTFTIQTPRLVVPGNDSTIIYRITLHLLMNNNGVEYWNTTSIILFIRVTPPNIQVYVIAAYWGSGKVYPGTSSASLHVRLLNTMDSTLRNIYAELQLPSEAFLEDTIHSGPYTLTAGSMEELVLNGIDVKPDAKPGNYTVKLVITGILDGNDGSWINVTVNYTIILGISDPRLKPLENILYEWPGQRPVLGARGLSLRIMLNLTIQSRILSGTATLIMPKGVEHGPTGLNNMTIQLPRLNYGEIGSITFTGIDVSNNTRNPAVFAVKYVYLLSINGAESWINQTIVFTQVFGKPRLNISIIDSGWTSQVMSNISVNAGFYITIQSLSRDRINQLIINTTPLGNAFFGNGHKYTVKTISLALNYGDTYTITFNGLTINTSRDSVGFEINVKARLETGQAVYYARRIYALRLPLNKTIRQIIIYNQYITSNNQPAMLLPNEKGSTLHLTILNIGPENIETLRAELRLPSGIWSYKPVDTCSGLAAGSICGLSYPIDTGSIIPGTYNASLELTYSLSSSGSIQYYHENLEIRLVVDDPANYKPSLLLLSRYWGTGQPAYTYPGDSYASLTVRIHNTAHYPAHNPIVRLVPLDKSIRVLDENKTCGTIGSTGTCTLTYHLDLRNAQPGIKTFKLVISYYVTIYGSLNKFEDTISFSIDLPNPETMINEQALIVTSSGWLNDWPVYPGDNDTVYTVTIANLYPYAIESILAKLQLPPGMREAYHGSLTAYTAGPVASLQETSMSFHIDIDENTEPGTYTATLILEYYVATDGSGWRARLNLPVVIRIDDERNTVIVAQYGWIGGEPSLDTHGSKYYVLVRNDKVPVIKGSILTVKLPPGIYSSMNRSSIVVATPSMIIPSTSIRSPAPTPQQLLSVLTQQAAIPTNPSLGIGDYAVYTMSLVLNLSKPGVYTLNSTLDFIDQWSTRQRVELVIPLVITGKPPALNTTLTNTTIVIRGGRGRVGLIVENNYDSPIYNVYIAFIPVSPVLVPDNNVRYYRVIKPHGRVTAWFNLTYNPVQVPESFTGGLITSSNGLFRIDIIYRDASGGVDYYNTSLTAIVKPFIDVELSKDTAATLTGSTLTVSGVVINYGIAPARSVEVLGYYSGKAGSTFIGDIDPASQAAFRLDVELGNGASGLTSNNVIVVVKYRDDYNTLYTKTYVLQIRRTEQVVTTTPPPRGASDYHILVITLVGLFLLGVFILLYRVMRAHMKRLTGGG